ncbi:MAG: hypothetical protein ACXWJ1_15295, partial [Caldimonas sp.]
MPLMAVGFFRVSASDWPAAFHREGVLHRAAKVQMVEHAQRLDRVGGRDLPVFDHQQVVAVAALAARRQVRRAGEHLGRGQVEIGDHELVVHVDALAAAPFGLEGLGRVLRQVGEVDQADAAVALLDRHTAGFVGEAVAEDRPCDQPVERLLGRARPDLVEEGDRVEHRRTRLLDRAAHRVERQRRRGVRREAHVHRHARRRGRRQLPLLRELAVLE